MYRTYVYTMYYIELELALLLSLNVDLIYNIRVCPINKNRMSKRCLVHGPVSK